MERDPIDVARARRETPGCEQVLHFDNAGAGLMPEPVVQALTEHLRLEAAIGGYAAAARAEESCERTYRSIARLIGCRPEEIALVENATRAWDMAFYSLRFGPGDRILTSVAEYASNYIAFLQVARRTGAEIVVVPSDDRGQLSVPALQDLIDDRVRLIAVTHVPTNGGLVNPAEAIGRLARSARVPFLLDACQSVGQLPISVEAIGCDLLSATGRKYLRGPRGTGFLYVRHDLIDSLEPPFLDLHAARWEARDRFRIRQDARRFENWESYVAGRIGLGVAVDYALAWGLLAIEARVTGLAERLRAALAEIPGVSVQDLGERRCGIVSFTMAGRDPKQIHDALARERINVTVSAVDSTRLDMEARQLDSLVRASVHYYNTEEEIGRFCKVLDRFSLG